MIPGLNSGNSYDDRRCHHAHYKLLEERVYDLRVICDFFEIGNCSRELVSICELEEVVKTRDSRCCCSYSFLRDVEKREIYWLGSSYAINKFLQDKINAKSLFITCVALELVNNMDKALSFC